MILYALYRLGVVLALALPVRFSYRIAVALADLFCALSAKDRLAVRRNLATALGEGADARALDAMTREVFRNFAKYLVDFFRFDRIDEAYIRRNVKIEGAANIDDVLAKGKGGIFLSAHIGNWELGGAAIALIGYPINAVVLTHQNRKINDFFTRQRLRVGLKPIEVGVSLRACYKALKRNETLALLGDRGFSKNGIFIEFFGKKTLMPIGPAAFCYRQGAALLPCFMTREPDDSFRLVIEEPIYVDRAMDERSAIEDLTRRSLRTIEARIRRYPAQWYVFRDLWESDDRKTLRSDTIL